MPRGRGRGGGTRSGPAGRNSSSQGTKSSAKATLKAAEQSQQRGERRSGHEAIPHFQEAVQKYRQCMAQSPDAETLANAQVLCSEALQLWAKATLAAEEHMPDSEQSISVEREAKQQALQLYAEAVQVGKQSKDASTGLWLRSDAAVNCGNCLSEAAELSSAEQQVSPLVETISCYEAAIALDPDAVTWSNLADVLIELAQALAATKRLTDAEEAVTRAHTAYQSATSLSSSEDGDDLPGLLCNWGTGLTAVGGMLRDTGAAGNAVEALKEAVKRLHCSLDLQPTDIQVHIALAEAQSGLAEALAATTAQNQQPGGYGSECAAGSWQEAATAALAACDAALNIDRNHISAHVVKAEVHALHAKLCHRCHNHTLGADGAVVGSAHTSDSRTDGGSSVLQQIPKGGCDSCAMHWESTRKCYEKVLAAPQKLGSCSERCTVRYNYACALAMGGRRQEAVGLLQWIAQKHPEGLAGAESDAELRCLWDLHEFKALIPASSRRN